MIVVGSAKLSSLIQVVELAMVLNVRVAKTIEWASRDWIVEANLEYTTVERVAKLEGEIVG